LLREFLHYVRPRGFGGRGTDQFSPLTRLIDAAHPDPFTEWQMLALARSTDDYPRLAEHFARMRAFDGELRGVVTRAPLVADGLPVATALADLGRIGGDAIAFLRRGEHPSAAWFADADAVIARTDGKTFGLLRPVGAASVKVLLARLR
jgi:hypothetical protein